MKDILTVSEAAHLFKKHPTTIRLWIKTKKLKARNIPAGKSGVYVLLRTDILELIVANTFKEKNNIVKKHKSRLKQSPQAKLPI